MNKTVHLIASNIAFPPDDGKTIDIYYKLKELSNLGVKIILHCFQFERLQAIKLNEICEKVYYYPGKNKLLASFSILPSEILQRRNKDLLNNLLKDDYPILFDSIYSTSFLKHTALKTRKKIVRIHQIEYQYLNYKPQDNLQSTDSFLFKLEALKLKNYELRISCADNVLTISEYDNRYFSKYKNNQLVPAFHGFNDVISEEGIGDYIIFHGDLGKNENQDVVNFLINEIFSEITFPFVIAGKNPPKELVDQVQNIPHINLFSNVNYEVMDKLIADSHICLIPTFQTSGFKIKLLNSLFAGRFCITNSAMVANTGLHYLCCIADNKEEIIDLIQKLMDEEFKQKHIEQRKLILNKLYSNEKNAQKIINIL